jgi:hypothetical protein
VYQHEYEPNYRILVVQDCVDTYDYADMPGRAICALQKHASQIDISNFFILVVHYFYRFQINYGQSYIDINETRLFFY